VRVTCPYLLKALVERSQLDHSIDESFDADALGHRTWVSNG